MEWLSTRAPQEKCPSLPGPWIDRKLVGTNLPREAIYRPLPVGSIASKIRAPWGPDRKREQSTTVARDGCERRPRIFRDRSIWMIDEQDRTVGEQVGGGFLG